MFRLLQCAAAFQSPLHKRQAALSSHPSLTEYERAFVSIDADGGATSTASRRITDTTKVDKLTLPLGTGDQEPITLVPISRNPVILRTSAPILKSQEECDAVAAFFEYMADGASANANNDDQDSSEPDNELLERGAELFQFLQRTINELVGGSNDDTESALPRFLTYDPQDPPIGGSAPTCDELLPDGLHVDNNNGMHFRYMPVLFYLTSNNAGATTFPLATPLSREDVDGRDLTSTSTTFATSATKDMEVSAQELIESGIYHTRGHHHGKLRGGETEQSTQTATALDIIEHAAVDLYQSQNQGGQRTSSHGRGVRVLPEAGYACAFLNLDESGCPDPLAFHGGESLLDVWGDGKQKKQKKLLTFFREVPVQEFKTRDDFVEKANGRRDEILHRYFLQHRHGQHQ